MYIPFVMYQVNLCNHSRIVQCNLSIMVRHKNVCWGGVWYREVKHIVKLQLWIFKNWLLLRGAYPRFNCPSLYLIFNKKSHYKNLKSVTLTSKLILIGHAVNKILTGISSICLWFSLRHLCMPEIKVFIKTKLKFHNKSSKSLALTTRTLSRMMHILNKTLVQ